jgi:peptide/nickel transport system substrate-binding protein
MVFMISKQKLLYTFSIPLLIVISLLQGCKSESPETSGRIVVGIDSDVKSFNPLFSSTGSEVNISELFFLSLVQYEWNDAEGGLDASPMLAEKWEWADDSSSIILYLRRDVQWSDGRIFNAEDVVFSFDVYSDPKVESRFCSFQVPPAAKKRTAFIFFL